MEAPRVKILFRAPPTLGLKTLAKEMFARRRRLEANYPYADAVSAETWEGDLGVVYDPDEGFVETVHGDRLADGTVPMTSVTWPG